MGRFPSNYRPKIKRAPDCVLDKCDRPNIARGLCRLHYDQIVAGQAAKPTEEVEHRNPVCDCPGDVVSCRFAGWGSIVCIRCERPPIESFGTDWTPELLAHVQSMTAGL